MEKHHQLHPAAKSQGQVLETAEAFDSPSAEAIPASRGDDGHSIAHKQLHRRRISDSDENVLSDQTVASTSMSAPSHHGPRKKTPLKHWRIVESSDEEADTLKDRFWRNLESGILPEDLTGGDLYSSVSIQTVLPTSVSVKSMICVVNLYVVFELHL